MSIDTLVPADNAAPLALLKGRASAIRLAEPGPSREQVLEMLEAAITVADHGRIRPWRFVVIQGKGRQRFGDLMAEAQKIAKPHLSEGELEKVRAKAFRAPVIVVLLCQAATGHKVPVIEQQMAVAAAGAHLMLAARALGFGSNWKTGAPAYEPVVREGLGFGDDTSIIGFFYIGTEPQPSPLSRATIGSAVQYWWNE